VPGLKKKPSTSELIDWMRLLAVQEVEARHLQGLDRGELPPLLGALLKNEQDISLLERLAQMQAQRR
jgi:hypothetical protein